MKENDMFKVTIKWECREEVDYLVFNIHIDDDGEFVNIISGSGIYPC